MRVSSSRISLITAVLSTFLIPQEDGESERVTGRERRESQTEVGGGVKSEGVADRKVKRREERRKTSFSSHYTSSLFRV